MKTIIALCLCAALAIFGFAACSNPKTPRLANEMQFSLAGITDVTISYDEENIQIYESDGDLLVIKEYMTEYRSSFFARVTNHAHSLHISEGGKPFFKDGFMRYVEVYLPAGYSQNLTVTSTDGNIDFTSTPLSLAALRIDSSSGTVTLERAKADSIDVSSTRGTLDLGNLEANQIRLATTSADIRCAALTGNVSCTSTSGNIDVAAASGMGSYTARNSGAMNVNYRLITGDIAFYNKNGDIALTLPEDSAFAFIATTKNGSVSTNFQQSVATSGRTTSGSVGIAPTVTVSVETTNGDIAVCKRGAEAG